MRHQRSRQRIRKARNENCAKRPTSTRKSRMASDENAFPFTRRLETVSRALLETPAKIPEKLRVPASPPVPSHSVNPNAQRPTGRRIRPICASQMAQVRGTRESGGERAEPLSTLVSLPSPEIPSTKAPHHGRLDSISATPTETRSRLGPSSSAPFTLNTRPNENRTAAHLKE